MGSPAVSRHLDELGLGHLVPGRTRVLPPPPPSRVAEGRMPWAATLPDLARADPEEVPFVPLELPEARAVGFRVLRHRDRPSVLRIRARGGLHARAFPPGGSAGCLVDEGGALVDLEGIEAAVILAMEEEIGLWMAQERAGLRVTELWPSGRQPVEPVLRSDAAAWAASLGDPWLEEEVRRRLAAGGALSEAIAVGLLARLVAPPSPARAREIVRRLVAGDVDPVLDRERAWARSLSPDQEDAVERQAVAAAEILLERLEEVADAPQPEDEAWQQDMLDLLHTRDDLEGVRVLLRTSGAGSALEEDLACLDERGAILVRAIPRWAASDERLRRAGTVSPEGWWTEPAGWEV